MKKQISSYKVIDSNRVENKRKRRSDFKGGGIKMRNFKGGPLTSMSRYKNIHKFCLMISLPAS